MICKKERRNSSLGFRFRNKILRENKQSRLHSKLQQTAGQAAASNKQQHGKLQQTAGQAAASSKQQHDKLQQTVGQVAASRKHQHGKLQQTAGHTASCLNKTCAKSKGNKVP